MLTLVRTARKARALDSALDAQRAVTWSRIHALHRGIHCRLISPTALCSSFAAGIVAGHLSDAGTRRVEPSAGEVTKPSPLHAALGFSGWALRVYLTQKTARFLRSVA